MNERKIANEACKLAYNKLNPLRAVEDLPTWKDLCTINEGKTTQVSEELVAFVHELRNNLDKTIFDRMGIASIIHKRYRNRFTRLTNEMVYATLKHCNYFSAFKATQRVREFGVKRVDSLISVSRTDLRGHFRQVHESNHAQWLSNIILGDWRRILTLGARLSLGDARSIYFKTSSRHFYAPFKVQVNNSHSLTVTILDVGPSNSFETLKTQFNNFLAAVSGDVITHYSVSADRRVIDIAFTGRVQEKPKIAEIMSKCPSIMAEFVKPVDPEDFVFIGDKKVEFTDATLIEDFYANKLEESIAEINTMLQPIEDKIFELSGRSSKLKAQRQKLINAIGMLRQ